MQNFVSPTRFVERFYAEVWNRADEAVAHEILSADFRFRASLGLETIGLSGFIGYMRSIHAALGNYTCTIIDMVEQADRVAARMRFSGLHRAEFLGVQATGREIVWSGAAFFRITANAISELWVLGDVNAVKRQLGLIDDPRPDP